MLALVLTFVLGGVAPGAPAAAKVAPVGFEDLVRYSDLVVVGTVTRIETFASRARPRKANEFEFDRLPPQVPFAEVAVERVLKGEPGLARVNFLATGTWTCDTTGAELGQRALFFLSTEPDGALIATELRAEVAASLPGSVATRVLWSGRGLMPLDRRGDEEFATYWAGDVVMPADFPSVPGPEPEYDFIRSARLADFARKLEELVHSQRATWLRAAVEGPWDASLAWQLELTWDRQARLAVQDPAGERVVQFQLTFEQTLRLVSALPAEDEPWPETFGTGTPRRGTRALTLPAKDGPRTLQLLWLAPDTPPTRELLCTLELWSLLRGLFDDPECADHRPGDRLFLR